MHSNDTVMPTSDREHSPDDHGRRDDGAPSTAGAPGSLASPARSPQRADFVKSFEHVVTSLLIGMMCFVIVLAVIDLAWVLIKDLLSPPLALLDIDELLEVFGLFLLVLIGIELLETLRSYARDRSIHVEVVILVAVIALARKIITLEPKNVSTGVLLGVAAMVIALGGAYFLIRK